MNTVAIIQARMGSTRLGGKVLKEISGKPVLLHLLSRLKHSQLIKKIVVATTTDKKDDIIAELVTGWGFEVFRGSENDLLDRYYQAAKRFNADPVIRVTSDCPLLDPKIVDQAIGAFLDGKYDAVFMDETTYPDGLGVAIYSFRALEKAWKEAKLPSEREHVGPYIEFHPEIFKIKILQYKDGIGYMRWTIDEEKDYLFIKEIYDRLYRENEIFHMEDILDVLKKEPELLEINKGIIHNEGYLKSLKEDEKYLEKAKNK